MQIINIASSYSSANTYLLVDEATNEAAMVDPGADAPYLLAETARRGVKITQIILTHGHFDHILALEEVRAATRAQVNIHRDDAVCLENKTFSLISMIGRDDTFAPAENLLCDGDTIDVGNSKIKLMHTPGHTAGSSCFVTDAGVITGDTLFCESIGRTDFPGGSFGVIEASIQKIYQTFPDETKLYPGHGSPTTVGHEKKYNPFVAWNSANA